MTRLSLNFYAVFLCKYSKNLESLQVLMSSVQVRYSPNDVLGPTHYGVSSVSSGIE
ncbi:MAG: hypothetical protein LBT46_10365 [Planctomycetaceae bacterium]|nr:hypothetical protein [Planctomycetaceae bacterium]